MTKDYRMTTGKYGGQLLSVIPKDYLIYFSKKKDCPKEIIDYLKKKNKGVLTLTKTDKLIAKGPKHPFFKGLFTKEAKAFMKLSPVERELFEDDLLKKAKKTLNIKKTWQRPTTKQH